MLAARCPAGDREAYAGWLRSIAERVCSASRSGGVLGVGGARTSEAERQFLDRPRRARSVADGATYAARFTGAIVAPDGLLTTAAFGCPYPHMVVSTEDFDLSDLPEPQLEVGVGPWPGDWPHDDRFDPRLLEDGDRRNVVDRYRYWRHEAIVADLDTRRHDFHVAIENWQHDFNIGTVVRNANAFLAREVHVVGRRRWNRRGAMVTDRYQHVRHHPTIEEFLGWAHGDGPGRRSASTTCRAPGRWRPRRCPGAACCCSARRVRACPTPLAMPVTRCSRSRSSARPGPSTPAWPAASRCTPGSGRTCRSRGCWPPGTVHREASWLVGSVRATRRCGLSEMSVPTFGLDSVL